ncbi:MULTISPECIES: cyanophycin synthetase [unclassified Polaribacter]|uniref:cyanophycin synthetase n=1 Tax=unclassified Polaribacter TaxID=196858 RepID=UPI0011BE1FFB|nr:MULTISPECIES: cyanophycin synthetase [unclassified Polaribacter]TXD53427.1 cyanophycin synthetase [Polaribacter sp. IC063]TXD61471.1 cyanophycin synthetase [Polaribacter sp. IC066]
MKIREINAMRGPNYWSVRRHKLIVMVLDLEEMEEFPSNKVNGFSERLKTMFPTMYSHRCSEGCAGGFFMRVDDGTWMGHIIEHIALEIQTLADMDTGFGRTRGYGEEGVYSVVFSYIEENVGRYAAKAAVKICEALIVGEAYDLTDDIQEMRELRESSRLGPSTGSIVAEAEARGIPWFRLNKYSLCQLGYGANQKRIQATVTSETSSIGVELACDKEDTKYLLEQAEVAVPKGDIIRRESSLEDACKYVGYPLVIKPVDGNHGRGITVDIQNYEDALEAFAHAKNSSKSGAIIVEKFVVGQDYRLLVINNVLVAAAKRTPAHVIGDGISSVETLIEVVNKDPRRGYGHENVLTKITINDLTETIIKDAGYTVASILEKDKMLILKDTANLSTGGTAEDVTDIVHPANVAMVERISKIIDLDICGIDIMSTDISKSLSETGGAVLEVNAGPGFRMHLAPTEGLPRNVAAPVIDKLFPPGATSRIPIIAISGTNGKTTTTRLIAHMAKMKGYKVGYTTSDGVYIQNRLLMEGDCTGPASAEFVLRDPTVNFAVLESARGGLLRAGLGFKNCDIGIVTNVAADHLGLKGIHTIAQLAKVKAVIPETVSPEGTAILNADDELVYAMRKNVTCNVALFSLDENNPHIKALQRVGGISAIYENGYITICRGEWKIRVIKAVNVPLTYGGKATFMIQNVLPAVVAAYIRGFSIDDMKMALETFIPSATQTPGRLNLFKFKNFQILLDYAHNPSGMRALKQFTDNIEATVKVGIIAGIGDRRVEDNNEMGAIAAEMFDEIIIRQDKQLRGKTEEELIKMVKDGILSQDPNKKIKIIPSEKEAILYAVKNVKKGALIVLSSDVIPDALNLVKALKEKEANELYEFTNDDIPNRH